MDRIGWVLLGWLGVSGVVLGGCETAAVITGAPTISARVQGMGRSAPIVVILTSVIIGYLLGHFWDGIATSVARKED